MQGIRDKNQSLESKNGWIKTQIYQLIRLTALRNRKDLQQIESAWKPIIQKWSQFAKQGSLFYVAVLGLEKINSFVKQDKWIVVTELTKEMNFKSHIETLKKRKVDS